MFVVINVGGCFVETKLRTLTRRCGRTRFFYACRDAAIRRRILFLDANIDTFHHIMAWFREGLCFREISVIRLRKVQMLAKRLGIHTLVREIDDYLYPQIGKIMTRELKQLVNCMDLVFPMADKENNIKQQLLEIIDDPAFTRLINKNQDDKEEHGLTRKFFSVASDICQYLLLHKQQPTSMKENKEVKSKDEDSNNRISNEEVEGTIDVPNVVSPTFNENEHTYQDSLFFYSTHPTYQNTSTQGT